MGKSLFGQLKNMLSRQKKSEISTPAQPQAAANLSRIGLGNAAPAPVNGPDMSGFTQMPEGPAPGMTVTGAAVGAGNTMPVAVQFFAEVPLQQSAEEIVSVSKRAANCINAEMNPAGEGRWTVSVTLNMAPVPQAIHEVETVLADWAGKLGGMSKGWGLAQGQAAA